MNLPERIESVEDLDEIMTRPGQALLESTGHLDGDLMLLGAGGKMGPSLAILAKRAFVAAGVARRVIAVSRFSDPNVRTKLNKAGVETVACDLLDPEAVQQLPEVENVIYLVGTKFGTSDDAARTWAVNAYLPGLIAHKFRHARIVLFSTGNVYPLVAVDSGGCTEADAVAPIGEYAQSALGRERVFAYFSRTLGIAGVVLRLNYAIDLRYGVLLDIAQKVHRRQPIDLSMGHVNVIWQGDANAVALRAFELVRTPPFILNVTGPETLSVRELAQRFGELFATAPLFQGEEADTALLSDATFCWRRFGKPAVDLEHMLRWTVHWIKIGGSTFGKATHYETRDGTF